MSPGLDRDEVAGREVLALLPEVRAQRAANGLRNYRRHGSRGAPNQIAFFRRHAPGILHVRKPISSEAIRPPDAFDKIAQKTGRSRAEILEIWRERAAIREYLGGLSRVEAELRAVSDTEALLQNQH